MTSGGPHRMTEPLFSFVHVADTHLAESCDVVTPFVDAINTERFHARPDFVVFGGDNIGGSARDGAVCARQMPMLKERLSRLAVPFDILCHNHDTWGEACRGTQYRHCFGESFDSTRELPHDFVAITVSGKYERDGTLIRGLIDRVPWLEQTLSRFTDKYVLLFAHLPLFPPRQPVPRERESMLKNPGGGWQAYRYGLQPDVSAPVRAAIARHGNVLVHYSGHCHVHSRRESEATWYVTTGALATQPWEYRHVTVFANRMEHRCICPHEVRGGTGFWTNCLDTDHPSVSLYHDGLPEERDFALCY